MSEKEHSEVQSPEHASGQGNGQAPYESIVSGVVAKIKNEPFLFVIAIAALIVGLVVLATGLGSPEPAKRLLRSRQCAPGRR